MSKMHPSLFAPFPPCNHLTSLMLLAMVQPLIDDIASGILPQLSNCDRSHMSVPGLRKG